MTVDRRQILRLATSAVVFQACMGGARAQPYPARPVRWLVGYAAGGANDIIARLSGQWLADRLGQPFVVENRPGAASNVATEAVARAAPDGYTLLMASAANAINATLYDKLGFDFIHDFAPVAGIARMTNVMLVHTLVPVASVPELIAYAKANPGKLSMASAGIGSPQHLAGELFKMMAEVDMLHVPYRGGGPALTDLLGGQVQACFATIASSVGYLKAGKLRALAVTGVDRSETLPDIPVMADFVRGYEASTWYGIVAPKGTSPEVINLLNKGVDSALSDAKFSARLTDLGGAPISGSPAEFAKLIVDETEKWGRVVKFAGAKA